MEMILKKWKDRRGEGLPFMIMGVVLLLSAILLILSLINVFVTVAYLDIAADLIARSAETTSSIEDEDTRALIEKYRRQYDAEISIEADEWESEAKGKIAYGSTFSVRISAQVRLFAFTNLSLPVSVRAEKYGVARHAWR